MSIEPGRHRHYLIEEWNDILAVAGRRFDDPVAALRAFRETVPPPGRTLSLSLFEDGRIIPLLQKKLNRGIAQL